MSDPTAPAITRPSVGSCSIALTEVGWVVIDTDLRALSPEWDAAWERGCDLCDLGICTDFDTVNDEYRWRPDATVDGLPVHDNPTMRAVLLEALERARSGSEATR